MGEGRKNKGRERGFFGDIFLKEGTGFRLGGEKLRLNVVLSLYFIDFGYLLMF